MFNLYAKFRCVCPGEKLQAEIDSLKEELRSRGKVYIGEMHGTIEGDAYQRKTS